MKVLFLSSLIMFCIVLAYTNKKHRKLEEKYQKDFWDREQQANNTRKKSLNNLDYITIPFDTLPMDILQDDADIAEMHTLLQNLSSQKIVNLTGYTNTDLKLAYGTANITVLSEYDQNYTLLVRTLQDWAKRLYAEGFMTETKSILEFAVSTGTDVSHSYYLLADIYDALGESAKKEALIAAAASINSSMKNVIVRTLQESGPYSG